MAEYAEVLRDSYWAKNISLYTIQEQAERVSERLNEDEDVAEFVTLMHQAVRYAGE